MSIDEFYELAAVYGLSFSEEEAEMYITHASKYNGTPVPRWSLENPMWCKDNPKAAKSGVYCTGEILSYWFLQMAQEIELEDVHTSIASGE